MSLRMWEIHIDVRETTDKVIYVTKHRWHNNIFSSVKRPHYFIVNFHQVISFWYCKLDNFCVGVIFVFFVLWSIVREPTSSLMHIYEVSHLWLKYCQLELWRETTIKQTNLLSMLFVFSKSLFSPLSCTSLDSLACRIFSTPPTSSDLLPTAPSLPSKYAVCLPVSHCSLCSVVPVWIPLPVGYFLPPPFHYIDLLSTALSLPSKYAVCLQ